ncbi:MAG: FMN-binding protein [Lachnospiraceae bacterium]
MKKRNGFFIIFFILIGMFISACGNDKNAQSQWKDGYYTAMMGDYNFGWKEYVTICVMDHKIVNVEYNAKNASGFIKSWDIAYMRNMNPVSGIYPNRYTRDYAKEFLEEQSAENIDLIAGATSSGYNFQKLAAAVLENASTGNTEIAIVPVEKKEE